MRYTFLLENMMRVNKPLLYIGESGTAKTVTIQAFLDNLDVNKYVNLGINFSSRTSSLKALNLLE